MTDKWTAGPWKAEIDNRIKHRQFVSSEERTICYVFTDDKTDANACLIAAAPDMIEALIRCYKIFDKSILPNDVEMLKSVIEKATGQNVADLVADLMEDK
jgi:hypothetical protein